MINASAQFATTIENASRQFRARLLYNSVAIDCDISKIVCTKGSCADKISTGCVFVPYLTATLKRCAQDLDGKELVYQIGLNISGSYEYIDIGYFTVTESTASHGAVDFTAIGRLGIVGNTEFTSLLSYPASISDLIDEIETATGLTIGLKDLTATGTIETAPYGTVLDVLGIIGGLLGGFVTEDNAGGVVISAYGSGDTVPILPYRSLKTPTFAEDDYEVTGIKVIKTEEHEEIQTVTVGGEDVEEYVTVPEVAFTNGTAAIVQKNEFMTQTLFDAMVLNFVGYTFRPGRVGVSLGDPRLEPWDTIEVEDLDGDTYEVPCFEVIHTFDGGLMTDVIADIETDDASATQIKGRLERAIDRIGASAQAAYGGALDAAQQAANAQATANATKEYFWFTSTDTGAGAGAHITQESQADFIANPTGGNTLINSNGMTVRDGLTELASFEATGAQIGQDNEQHTQILNNGFFVKDAEGNDTGKIYHNYLSNKIITLGRTTASGNTAPLMDFWNVNAYNTFELPSDAKNGTTITCYIVPAPNPDPPTSAELTTLTLTAGSATSGSASTAYWGYTLTYTYDGSRAITLLMQENVDMELVGVKYTILTQYLPNLKIGNDVWAGQQITSGLPNSFVRVDNGNVRIFNTERFRALNEVYHEPGKPGYHNSLMINGRDMFGGGKILWRSSAGWYVTDQQTVQLNEPLSSQPHGIILAWSTYDPTTSAARNYGWHFDFIPKFYLDFSEGGDWGTWYGQGMYVEMPDSLTNNTVRRKYIYISDDSITGHANNSASGTGYANNHMVLRYVIGI